MTWTVVHQELKTIEEWKKENTELQELYNDEKMTVEVLEQFVNEATLKYDKVAELLEVK